MAALVAVSEGSLSSGGKGSGWCSSSISTPVRPPSPQYFSFVASFMRMLHHRMDEFVDDSVFLHTICVVFQMLDTLLSFLKTR